MAKITRNFKALLHEIYTKRDMYGNTYHTVRVINPKNGLGFTVETPSIGNVTGILNSLFSPDNHKFQDYYTTKECTNSARISSLPEHIYLNACRGSEEWKKELRKIGYRLPKGNTEK